MTIQNTAAVVGAPRGGAPRLPDLVGRALKRMHRPLDGPSEMPIVGGVADPSEFAAVLTATFGRSGPALLASIWIVEMPHLERRYGGAFVFERVTELIALAYDHLAPEDVFTVAEDGEIMILAPGDGEAAGRIERLCRVIACGRIGERGDRIGLTPIAGLAALADGSSASEVLQRAIAARAVAIPRRDGRVLRWQPKAPDVPAAQDRRATAPDPAAVWSDAPLRDPAPRSGAASPDRASQRVAGPRGGVERSVSPDVARRRTAGPPERAERSESTSPTPPSGPTERVARPATSELPTRSQPATTARSDRASHAAIAAIAASVTSRSSFAELTRLATERESTAPDVDRDELPQRTREPNSAREPVGDLPRRETSEQRVGEDAVRP